MVAEGQMFSFSPTLAKRIIQNSLLMCGTKFAAVVLINVIILVGIAKNFSVMEARENTFLFFFFYVIFRWG